MKELKFRAWVKKRKGYRELDQLGFDKQGLEEVWVFPEDDETQQVYHPSEMVIEQYTGLKDKNGKEIYEGDIVKWLDGLNEYIAFSVEWQENRARFCLRNQYSHYDYEDLNDKKKPYIEVVGNIHENPELLGGEE